MKIINVGGLKSYLTINIVNNTQYRIFYNL